MLINKHSQLEAGSIFIFKMTNGEEIIARVKAVTDTAVEVKLPMSVFVTPDHQLGMQPSLFSIDVEKHVTLYKSAIAMSAPPAAHIADTYEKQTTGISFA